MLAFTVHDHALVIPHVLLGCCESMQQHQCLIHSLDCAFADAEMRHSLGPDSAVSMKSLMPSTRGTGLLLIQVCSDPKPHCSWQMRSLLVYAAVKVRLTAACDTAMTPVKVCCSYKAAATQIQCTAAPVVGKMHCPLLSAALQTRLTAAL